MIQDLRNMIMDGGEKKVRFEGGEVEAENQEGIISDIYQDEE